MADPPRGCQPGGQSGLQSADAIVGQVDVGDVALGVFFPCECCCIFVVSVVTVAEELKAATSLSLRGDLEGDRFTRVIDSPLGPWSPRPVSSLVTFFKTPNV